MLLLFLTPQLSATEIEWSRKIAQGSVIDGVSGEAEFKLPDGSRVDVLSDEYAWEVEWSDKWEESIGQSLWYSIASERKPGVILLLRGDRDEDYLRCLAVCRKAGIRLLTVETGE